MSEDNKKAGNLQGKVGYGKPPVDTRFGGLRANKQNRRGRIISGRETFRKEFEKIWAEIMFDDNGNPIIDPANEKPLTRLRAQMRAMTTSSNVRKVELAMAYTFGKPKEEVDISNSDGTLKPIVQIFIPDNARDNPDTTTG
jgi:hypothetical protein